MLTERLSAAQTAYLLEFEILSVQYENALKEVEQGRRKIKEIETKLET